MNKAKIATDKNRASHLLTTAELDGIICSGALGDGRLTYALLEKRIPKPIHLSREEALAILAKKYFLSRSPASFDDFAWWSGLSIKDARIGIEANKDDFEPMEIEGEQYWVSKSEKTPIEPNSLDLLPAFNEFTISYAGRSASLPYIKQIKAVSNNGIFRPMVLLDGQVLGI